ncbi:MAG: adenine phosphoribosyltransferase [bacterium]
MGLEEKIRSVPDFPKEGILFRDITTLLKDGAALAAAADALYEPFRKERVDRVAAVESRGFIFGAPIALKAGCGFVPIRKPGKLPAAVESAEYELEYGADRIEVHRDAVEPGQRVLLVDDLLATGGTMAAAVRLIVRLGGEVAGIAFLIELADLKGREKLKGHRVHSVIVY